MSVPTRLGRGCATAEGTPALACRRRSGQAVKANRYPLYLGFGPHESPRSPAAPHASAWSPYATAVGRRGANARGYAPRSTNNLFHSPGGRSSSALATCGVCRKVKQFRGMPLHASTRPQATSKRKKRTTRGASTAVAGQWPLCRKAHARRRRAHRLATFELLVVDASPQAPTRGSTRPWTAPPRPRRARSPRSSAMSPNRRHLLHFHRRRPSSLLRRRPVKNPKHRKPRLACPGVYCVATTRGSAPRGHLCDRRGCRPRATSRRVARGKTAIQ
mmetsp:Transcript_49715/g.139157  ORF Transcript_49715/g.139157 Transcript_49715/m.139157 type:complete len:274 (-) Transcript_49715:328-1149(-)